MYINVLIIDVRQLEINLACDFEITLFYGMADGISVYSFDNL